uniref:Retrotransposon gag domain-containing protein n=1 Tax=Tanacetum cinerariifolium TaxID=118510 RepID=A0A6L2NHK7_TANCI|nr:hypothetical protein CTI12_AA123990 [Tanacetum cinerariifolium]
MVVQDEVKQKGDSNSVVYNNFIDKQHRAKKFDVANFVMVDLRKKLQADTHNKLKMKIVMFAWFLSVDYKKTLYSLYQNCRQSTQTVTEYAEEFMRLASCNQLSESDGQQVAWFNNGLRYDIQAIVSLQTTWTIDEGVRITLKAEETIKKHGTGSSMYKTKTDTNQSSTSQSGGDAQVDHSKSTHKVDGGKKKTTTITTSTHAINKSSINPYARPVGAASIPKKITVDLKGKAIADLNNVATTKTGWTTTCNLLFKKKTSSLPLESITLLVLLAFEVLNFFAIFFSDQGKKHQKTGGNQPPWPHQELHPTNVPTAMQQCGMRKEITTETRIETQHSHFVANKNQLGAFMDTDSEEGVDGTIVGSLIRILDADSAIAKAFWMARDWCHADATTNVELRLLSERTRSKQYNSPIVIEVAALIINDFGDREPIRDIVVCKKDSWPKSISELHPSYMALQYPLLFLFGEDSYHEKILYHTNKGKRKTTRDYVTMKEYYTYVIQYRKYQQTTLHRGGRCKATIDIDDIISTELLSLTDDPARYKVVSDYMLREPCGRIIDPEHHVTLLDTDCLPALLQKEGIDVAMFTDWFDLSE